MLEIDEWEDDLYPYEMPVEIMAQLYYIREQIAEPGQKHLPCTEASRSRYGTECLLKSKLAGLPDATRISVSR